VKDVAPNPGVTCGLTTGAPGLVPGILGVLYGCPSSSLNGKFVGTPSFFNFFRPSGPNPSFATATALSAPQCQGAPTSALLSCGFALQQALAGAAGFPVGVPGVPIPFNSVDAQVSNGNSWYNALTVNLEKRFSNHFELLSSNTWSHSIDDSTDLHPRWSRKTAVSLGWNAPTPSTTSATAGSPAPSSSLLPINLARPSGTAS